MFLVMVMPYPVDYFDKNNLNCPYSKNKQACVEWNFYVASLLFAKWMLGFDADVFGGDSGSAGRALVFHAHDSGKEESWLGKHHEKVLPTGEISGFLVCS